MHYGRTVKQGLRGEYDGVLRGGASSHLEPPLLNTSIPAGETLCLTAPAGHCMTLHQEAALWWQPVMHNKGIPAVCTLVCIGRQAV